MKKFTTHVRESREEMHHEQDFNMARVQLEDIVKNAQYVLDNLDSEEKLPAWVSDKLSITNHNLEAIEGWLRR